MATGIVRFLAICGLTLVGASASAGNLKEGLKPGTPELKAAGPLAFGPDGILFVADPQSVSVVAIDTRETGRQKSASLAGIEDIDVKVAAALGTSAEQILINDMAVNPASGSVYLSVSRGRGPDALPVLLRITSAGEIEEVGLENVPFAEVDLPGAPEDRVEGRQNPRRESITDLAFVDGRLIIAGLSNEEFASKLRAIPFPFEEADAGTSVEIFHGSHGRFETRSPVRTFVPVEVGGEAYLIAAYTCTPLVKFPVKDLAPGTKVRGTTVAELGNRNRPLDMITYTKGGKTYLLMANSARGVMRIPTDGIESAEGIEDRVPDTAGVEFETIKGWDGITQLDRISDDMVAVIVERNGKTNLEAMQTP